MEDQTHRVMESLNVGELDLIILATTHTHEKLASIDLFEEKFFLVVSKDHPLTKKKRIQISDISEEKILLLEDGHCLRDQALAVCHLSGAKEAGFRATSLETLRPMVATGLGITFLPEPIKPQSKRDKLLAVLPFEEPKLTRKISLCYRKNCSRILCFEEIAKIIKTSLKNILTL